MATATNTNPFSLTEQELQVVKGIADGRCTKEIAEQMRLSPKTVEFHRGAVMRKLQIHDVPTLVRFAVKHNLVTPEPAKAAKVVDPIRSVPQLAEALLRGASAAAAGEADVLQVNALCQCSDALIRLARLQMDATAADRKVPWLT